MVSLFELRSGLFLTRSPRMCKTKIKCGDCRKEVESTKLCYPGALCKSCFAKKTKELRKKKKENARPGLVEVAYGVHPAPKEDGCVRGRGYAYRSTIPNLGLGDIVVVPGNWLHKGNQEATVVSTYSDYDGPTASLLCLLRKHV